MTERGENVEHRSRCRLCLGNACEEGCGYCDHISAGPDSHKVCRRCGGIGLEPLPDSGSTEESND